MSEGSTEFVPPVVDDEDGPLKEAHGEYIEGPQEEDFHG